MSMNLLKIKDVEISFDAEIGQLESNPADDNEKTDKGLPKSISVDVAGTRQDKGGSIHVVLRVEGSEPTDGAARLMNHLSQTQGVFKKD